MCKKCRPDTYIPAMSQFQIVRTKCGEYLTLVDTSRYDPVWGFHKVLRVFGDGHVG